MIGTGPIVVFVFVLFIALIAFIGFVIYFFFKILQFVVQATNIYKKILRREDTIIKILLDIRDNTKKVQIDWNQIDSESNPSRVSYCPNCGRPDAFYDVYGNLFCPNCKQVIDPKLASQAPTQKPEIIRCPRCGKTPEDLDADFCDECGTKLK